jgi:hypothetical protein
MTSFELSTLCVIAIAILAGLLVRARMLVRAESRRELLERIVDPARGGVPIDHDTDVGHDDAA